MDERYYKGLRDGLWQVLTMLQGLNNKKNMRDKDVIECFGLVQDALVASISMTNDKIFAIRKEINNELE